MRVTEFLKGRDVERQTVTRYINRHEEIFNGHTKKVGKEIDLDSFAVKELEKVYPYPKPLTVINGVPEEEFIRVQNDLIVSQKKINELQNKLLEVQEQIAMAMATEQLLEEKTMRFAELEARDKAKEQEIKDLQEMLAKERSRTWWQKLINK